MKYIESKIEGNWIWLRYHTTWRLSWNLLLDVMQVFLDDISENVQLADYISVVGDESTPIGTIPMGYLHKAENLKDEKGGISLAGISRAMEIPIRLTLYNQLNIADLQVQLGNEKILKEFTDNPRVLDTYLDSIEINGYGRNSKRSGMKLVQQFAGSIENRDAEKHGQVAYNYFQACESLNIEPNFYESEGGSEDSNNV